MALRRPRKRMKLVTCRFLPIVWWFCRSPPRLDSGLRRNDELGGRNDDERLLGRSIPDRGPGHAFVAIVHAGDNRHTKV